MRRIYHRAYSIEAACHFHIILAYDLRIQLTVNHNAVYISGNTDSFFVQLFAGVSGKSTDRLLFGNICIFPKVHLLHAAVCGKADVIVLHLIKPDSSGLFPDLNQIVPHFFFIRIYPGKSALVIKDGTVCLMKAPFRFLLCQIRILESYHSGDKINSLFLTFLYQSRHIFHVSFGSSNLLHLGYLHIIRDSSVIIFDIDYQRIQFCLIHKRCQIIHAGSTSHRPCHIDSFDFYRLFFRNLLCLRFFFRCFVCLGFRFLLHRCLFFCLRVSRCFLPGLCHMDRRGDFLLTAAGRQHHPQGQYDHAHSCFCLSFHVFSCLCYHYTIFLYPGCLQTFQ